MDKVLFQGMSPEAICKALQQLTTHEYQPGSHIDKRTINRDADYSR